MTPGNRGSERADVETAWSPKPGQGVYAISVAAAMVSMEIHNLRVYERHGLLTPRRTAGGTRQYSANDVHRLRRIGQLLAEGLNLAGIGYVLRLEEEISDLRDQVEGEHQRPKPTGHRLPATPAQ